MALDIAGGVIERLKGSAPFVASLGVYTPEGSAPVPAIFSDPVPPDFDIGDQPCVIVGEPHINEAVDDFTSNRREAVLRLRMFVKHNGSAVALNNAAEDARSLVHNWSAPVFSSGELEAATASGPFPGQTSDPSIEGRIINLRLLIKEN